MSRPDALMPARQLSACHPIHRHATAWCQRTRARVQAKVRERALEAMRLEQAERLNAWESAKAHVFLDVVARAARAYGAYFSGGVDAASRSGEVVASIERARDSSVMRQVSLFAFWHVRASTHWPRATFAREAGDELLMKKRRESLVEVTLVCVFAVPGACWPKPRALCLQVESEGAMRAAVAAQLGAHDAGSEGTPGSPDCGSSHAARRAAWAAAGPVQMTNSQVALTQEISSFMRASHAPAGSEQEVRVHDKPESRSIVLRPRMYASTSAFVEGAPRKGGVNQRVYYDRGAAWQLCAICWRAIRSTTCRFGF